MLRRKRRLLHCPLSLMQGSMFVYDLWDGFVMTLKGKGFAGVFCAAFFVLASPAGAATPVETLDNSPSAPIGGPAPNLVPETQPYRPLFPIEDDDLASFISHATTNATNAVSSPETSAWVKM